MTTKLETNYIRIDSRATGNSGFKKLAVQWLNEAWFFVSSSVLADSFRLRNRQLLKPAKRYTPARKTTETANRLKISICD
jgi:hypothetical protein